MTQLKRGLIYIILLTIAVGCDIINPKNDTKQVTVTALDAQTNALLDSLTVYIDGEVVARDATQPSIERKKNKTETIKVARSGYITEGKVVTFDHNKQELFLLTRKPPKPVTKTLTPKDGDEILHTAVHTDDVTNKKLGEGQVDLTFPADTTITVRTSLSGYVSAVTEITFSDSSSVEVGLEKDHPDEVALSYNILADDNGPLDGVNFSINGQIISHDASGSEVLPYSKESVVICGQATYYKTSCDTLALTQDQEITLTLARKKVAVHVTPKIIGYDDYVEVWNFSSGFEVDRTAYILQIGDSVWANIGDSVNTSNLPMDIQHSRELELGEGVTSTVTYPVGPENLEATVWVQYFPESGHEHSVNTDNFLNVAEGSIELSSNKDSDITLDLSHVPACSDGVDNDFYNGVDADDLGCVDPKTGIHDPDDDVELMRRKTSTSYGWTEKIFVSGKPGEQETELVSPRKFNPSITIAQSITVELMARVEERQTGEEFAIRFYTGSSRDNLNHVNITDIIPDEGLEGWKVVRFYELNKTWFKYGTYYKIEVVHAAALADTVTNGNDDVVIVEDGSKAYIETQWDYQPERAPEESAKAKMAVADPNVKVKISNLGLDTDIHR
ncbi:hypothetical protein [Gracilimonas mengyeensis]|uniref:PEGA domain-containing protein n=1 Tax=Gracilimonas mengyeensis TaxID=1302730 RepID=A0A521BJP1_9BACT|nr:hypothetical protein [Gracilimonas mengyeensis]SMO46880.1 hypothetical protein SAMN06265219_102307 [Gracilimonas mengyeensis]